MNTKSFSNSALWRLRAFGILAVVAAAVYVISCVIYNMPNSPVKVRVITYANYVMDPWFEQDWQLFAPTPSTSNDHIIATVRAQGPNGSIITEPGFDIEAPIEDLPRSNHLLPTKQPGITLALQEEFASYANQLQIIDSATTQDRAELHARLDKRYASQFNELARIISYEAQIKYPNLDIIAVRAAFTDTPTVPFSERYLAHPPALAQQTLLTTNWLQYYPGVGE